MNEISLHDHVHGDISRIMEEVVTEVCKPLAKYKESLVPALPKKDGAGLELEETGWGNVLTDVQIEIRRATQAHPRTKGAYKSFTIPPNEKAQTWKDKKNLKDVRKAFATRILKQVGES